MIADYLKKKSIQLCIKSVFMLINTSLPEQKQNQTITSVNLSKNKQSYLSSIHNFYTIILRRNEIKFNFD